MTGWGMVCACAFLILATTTNGLAQDQAPRDPRWLPLLNQQTAPEPELGAPIPRKGKSPFRLNLPVSAADLPRMLSKPLSTDCALGRFNQAENERYYITLKNTDGSPLRLGVGGQKVGNLRDRAAKSDPSLLYLFDKDYTSSCTVYSMKAP